MAARQPISGPKKVEYIDPQGTAVNADTEQDSRHQDGMTQEPPAHKPSRNKVGRTGKFDGILQEGSLRAGTQHIKARIYRMPCACCHSSVGSSDYLMQAKATQ